MISFELTQEQKLAQSMVHELAGAQLRPAARGADDREAIPSSVVDEIWATGIIQSQADATARSATLNALLRRGAVMRTGENGAALWQKAQ